jgi:arylsulfatase A-like enzyme
LISFLLHSFEKRMTLNHDLRAVLKLLRPALALALAIGPALATAQPSQSLQSSRPNVILIVTDDQGYGDLGFHGNPKLHTPNLDRLAREAVQFQSFYVSPVCSPTRASLMTGRYSYRTGVVDTYLGRSLMHPDETTIAELLSQAGYRTGIFGKWHLGDNYPLRAMDQGFQESLVLNGGGIGQPSDPVGGESYFDPMLRRNGLWVKTKGYVSDVITDAAIAFIDTHQRQPFFTYLAFNAPHTPLEVPADKYAKYKAMNLQAQDFAGAGHPLPADFNPDVTAKVYGMVENIDDNIGRLLARLDALKLSDRTIVLFMTDNGPQQPRFNAGLPRLKGTVHEGGIRVPFFVRWPGTFPGGRTVDAIAAHIDVTPTLIDVCGARPPAGFKMDGESLLPLLKGAGAKWPDRTLFFQWHRGDVPELYRAFAARSQRYKLIQPLGGGQNKLPAQFAAQLYDMAADPLEQRNIAAEQPELVRRMTREYEAWFTDVTSGRDYTDSGIARIGIGSVHENPVRLTRQDWRGVQSGWTPTSLGHWEVDVRRAGMYEATVRFDKLDRPGTISLVVGAATLKKELPPGETTTTFDQLRLAAGAGRLESWVALDERRIGVLDVVVKRVR